MSGLSLFIHQLRYDLKLFWRNPAAVFFSVGLPLVFLFLLGALFGGDDSGEGTYGLAADQYLVPAIMTLGIVSASFMNMAMTITYQRETGQLKRLRGTPLPTVHFVGARTTTAVVNSLLIAGVILIAGRLAYGIEIGLSRLLGTLLLTLIGAVSFSALGFALTIVIPNEGAAPAITNMIALPLYFVSGIFGPASQLPTVLADIGQLFPISHLGACFFELFSPQASGVIAFTLTDVAVVVAWGLFGLAMSAWKFRWEPQGN